MPARRHGVAEIASSLSLGEQTFRRHIFAATGLAPKDFITSVQMREAARLLIDCQDVRIRDVGCRCGFDDASAFTNAHPKGFNFFIGMDHILGKTSKEFIPLSSNASLNLGMNVTF